MWETWGGGGSQNHHMFGTISEWFYKHILGIKILSPGFEQIEIRPCFDGLSFAEGWHKTPHGTIKIRWDKNESEVMYTVEVPVNIKVKIVPPIGYSRDIKEASCGKYIIAFTPEIE